VLSVLVGLGIAGCVLIQAGLLARLITDAFVHGSGLADLREPLALLAVVVVARAFLAWAQDVVAARSSATVKQQLREALLGHAAALVPSATSALAGRRTADLAALATRGIDALDAYFARYLPQLVLAVLVPPLVLLRIGVADVLSAIVVLVTLPLIPVFLVLVGWSTQRLTQRQWSSLQTLSRHFLDVVEGLPTLRVFGRAKAQVETVGRVTDEWRRATLRVLRLSFLSALVLELTATLSVALVAVSVGLRLLDGDVALQTALLVLILAPEAYLPLRQLGVHYHAATEGVAAAEQVFEILERPVPVTGARADVPDLRAATIRVDHLTVWYSGRDRPALSDLDLVVEPGELVAVVGPSGCGKSTLLSVLMRFVEPTGGMVWLDGGDDGRRMEIDLADLDAAAWRRQVAWVPQRPALLAGTVADNIRLGAAGMGDAGADGSADGSTVRRALALAAGDDIDPGAKVGEDGVGLSLGQRQRVALARAFYRALTSDVRLLLLDEPTAHLDLMTEARVVATLRALAGDRTILVVAHRPAIAASADRMVSVELAEVPA
jgi:thiol reductant ABC exporter CydD subunit